MSSLQELLASGDVDAVRRFLKHDLEPSSHQPAEERRERAELHPARSSSSLFARQPVIKLAIGNVALQLCSHRSMGKIVWPAGHAVGALLSKLSERDAGRFSLIEVGAGAGVPSLVAAAVGLRSVATDFTEECVELLVHNDALNGHRLGACARLDVAEHSELKRLMASHGLFDAPAQVIVSCDCSCACFDSHVLGEPYSLLCSDCHAPSVACADDPKTVADLFASASMVLDYPAANALILVARIKLFSHVDEHTFAVASSHGFELVGRTAHEAAGVLDAVSQTFLTPCAENEVECFFFGRQQTKPHGATVHPALELLIRTVSADAQVPEPISTTRGSDALWAVAID